MGLKESWNWLPGQSTIELAVAKYYWHICTWSFEPKYIIVGPCLFCVFWIEECPCWEFVRYRTLCSFCCVADRTWSGSWINTDASSGLKTGRVYIVLVDLYLLFLYEQWRVFRIDGWSCICCRYCKPVLIWTIVFLLDWRLSLFVWVPRYWLMCLLYWRIEFVYVHGFAAAVWYIFCTGAVGFLSVPCQDVFAVRLRVVNPQLQQK